jgi:hypothetical protein
MIPVNNRIANLVALATLEAPAGTTVWVDSEGCKYEAVPTYQAATNAIAGPSDLDPISWQPSTSRTILLNGTSVNASAYGAVEGPSAVAGVYTFLPSGTADDWARFNTLITAGWRKFRLVDGIYRATTPLRMVSNLEITLSKGTDIRCNLSTAGPTDACFSCVSPLSSASATLNAIAYSGDIAITVQEPTVAGKLAVGCFVILYNGAHPAAISLFRVEKVTGSSAPYTLTLDRAVQRQRAATDTIGIYTSVLENVIILGNGAKVSGVMNRVHELSIAWNCHAYGIFASDEYGACTGPYFSMDIPSYGCSFDLCEIKVATPVPTQPGFYLESNEGSYIRSCKWSGLGGGSQLVDCTDCHVVDCVGMNNTTVGVYLGAGTGDLTEGCVNCSVDGGKYSGSANGVRVSDRSLRSIVRGVVSSGNTYGIVLDQYTLGSLVESCTVRSCAQGILPVANNTSTFRSNVVENCTVGILCGTASGGTGTGVGIRCVIDDYRFSGSSNLHTPMEIKTGATVTLKNSVINCASSAGITCGQAGGNIKLTIDNLELNCPTHCNGIVTGGAGSVLDLSRVKVTGCSTASYYAITRSDAGGVIYLGPNNDFSTAAAAYHTACEVSYRDVTLTGTTPVAFAFAALAAGSQVQVTPVSYVGTPGDRTITKTAGTGLSIVSSSASDTGVVSVKIGEPMASPINSLGGL